MSGPGKDIRALLRRLRKAGYKYHVRGSGHYAVETPNGYVIVSGSPRSHRTIHHTKADLRRKGVPREVTGSAEQGPQEQFVVRERNRWGTGGQQDPAPHDFHPRFGVNHFHLSERRFESTLE